MTTSSTTGTTLWDEMQSVAAEWENDGWLHKYHDERGREIWALTALGRRKLGYGHLTREQRNEIAQGTLRAARYLMGKTT